MKEQNDFIYNAKLIIAGLNRRVYTSNEVAQYLYEAYKKGLEDGKEKKGHHAVYSYKGVF